MPTLYLGSTVSEGALLLMGGGVLFAYTLSVIEQSFEQWRSIVTTQDLIRWTGYLFSQLSLVGLYALMAYFVAAEELSDPGFRALRDLFSGGI